MACGRAWTTLLLFAFLPAVTLWLSLCHALTSVPPPRAFLPPRSSLSSWRLPLTPSSSVDGLPRPRRVRPPTRRRALVNEDTDVPDTNAPGTDAADVEHSQHLVTLCAERNLPLLQVKNARDLASVRGSPVRPGRVYRTGRVSDATSDDLDLLFGELGVKTLVDLRSPTELRDDLTLERPEVLVNFTDMVFREYGLHRMVKELGPEETRLQRRGTRERVRSAVDGARRGTKDVLLGFVDNFFGHVDDGDEGEGDDECVGCIEAERLILESRWRRGRNERHFVSIMNEVKYARGTLAKLRKRDIAKTIIRSPTTIVSRQARENIKQPFLDEINDGGLTMLNELLLRFGAPGIKYVLDLISDENRHPVAFYCTAGKDRTGMIAAIILALLGTADDAIVEDYSLSANVYAEMADHKAMVGALSQRNLNATTFLGAPPQVMEDTLKDIRNTYGSVEDYLDFIGFHEDSRKRLIHVLTKH